MMLAHHERSGVKRREAEWWESVAQTVEWRSHG